MIWQPRTNDHPGETVLRGRHVTLLPVRTPGVADRITAAMAYQPDDIWQYLHYGPFTDEAPLREVLSSGHGQGDRFMGFELETGEMAGFGAFLRVRPEHGSAELGSLTYGRKLQRTRAGTELIFLMLSHLFDDLGWRRAEWKCNTLNAPSIAAAGRYGFVYEGCFRQDIIWKGKNRDTAWFSIIDKEWPARRDAFREWLSDDNFDARGHQHRSLRHLMPQPKARPGFS